MAAPAASPYIVVRRAGARKSPGPATTRQPEPGGPIRALGVSLLAVATVAASLAITRYRSQRAPDPGPEIEASGGAVSVDALRRAGL